MAIQVDMRRLRRNPHIVVASLTANVLGLALPLLMLQIYDRIIPKQGHETLLVLAVGLIGAAIAEFTIRMARGHLVALASMRFDDYAYKEAFARMLKFGTLDRHEDQGTQHERLASIDRVRKHHSSDAATALLDVPFIFLFVTVLALISPVLGIALCGLAAFSLAVVWIQRKRILAMTLERQDRDRRRHSFLVETLEGIEMIKSLGIENLLQRRYEKLMSVSALVTHDMNGQINRTQGITATIGLMAPVFMSGVGSLLVLSGQMTMGGLAAAVLLTGRVVQPTLRIEALMAGEKDIKKSEVEVQELLNAPLRHTGRAHIDQVRQIRLDGVSVSPGNEDKIVLDDVSLTLTRGDCVVVNGAEGSGRSVLLGVLSGHLAPNAGHVFINGQPLAEISGDALSDRVSLLSPEATLLEGTLLENLTAFDEAKYRDVAFALSEELGIKEFISRHADGLSMRVAARTATSLPKSVHDGVLLISGLVRAPDVILFDEANAGLDRGTDLRMIEILRKRVPHCITVMVTHRPSYMALANRTYLLRDGRLIEQTPDAFSAQVAS